ncbi:MAG: alpha/beta hydrolase [Methanobrevibacter ruminantium]|uniref:alpha/beta fold hydrolase n=1 Tax=Methanobrevibacter ruminantium TaxID=83816 RepID=UPI0026ECF015|nr:alpha/beta hydrolase [Methanobrevibacter ruminantium]MCI5737920.1 alpha/beta hydrolase [Methanobrevibacter ruminantium]MDD6049090.1 alpha/beta hydrolase [Methanobrevibacter ruminantium]
MTKKTINDLNINYELEGEGKTIVFVHGLSDSLAYWKVLSENLKNDYQTLIYDLRGHGESSDDDKNTTINLYQEDLYQLLKALNIENAVFVGLSLGGNIILDLAVNHPEMVNGLVVMSSFPEHDENLKKIFNDFDNAIDQGFVEFFDTILPYTLTDDMLEEHKELLENVKFEAAKTANLEGIKKGINAGYGFNLTDRLNEINVPTLVIAGEEDNLTTLDIQRKISDNIRDCELIVLEKTKHNILIGRNIEKLLNIINDFMLKIG